MNVNDAFRIFQQAVNAEPEQVSEARTRRDSFKNAFGGESDVNEVLASGSLARGTQKEPIHDVDLVIIFDEDEHPDWGQPGGSAAEALDYTGGRVNHLLGATHGTSDQVVRLASPRNHAVKCFLDDPKDPNGFTVDAVPALRRSGSLLIPEAVSNTWVYSDPEYMIAIVAERHKQWKKFAGTVRMLKWWAEHQSVRVKSLVLEVLAIQFLPESPASQPSALKDFFVSAAHHIDGGNLVSDPAGLCGPIQQDLDYDAFAECLSAARDAAALAFEAQVHNDVDGALRQWQKVLGSAFPAPPKTPGSPATLPITGPRPVKDSPQG